MTVLGTNTEDPSILAFQGLRELTKPLYRGHSSLHLVLIMKILPRLQLLATRVVDLSRSVARLACVAARTSAVQEY